jgi:hypothetical protein
MNARKKTKTPQINDLQGSTRSEKLAGIRRAGDDVPMTRDSVPY